MSKLEIDKDFLAEYGDMISKYIWSKALEGREEYENLYNDVIIKLLEHKDKYDPDRGAVTTWVTWVMMSVVSHYFRDKQQDALHNSLPLLPEEIAGYSNSQDPSDQEDILSIISKVRGLSSRERNLLIDFAHLGYSLEELATRDKIPMRTLQTQLNRARAKLIKQVQGELNEQEE